VAYFFYEIGRKLFHALDIPGIGDLGHPRSLALAPFGAMAHIASACFGTASGAPQLSAAAIFEPLGCGFVRLDLGQLCILPV